jgi:hypothetical protein
MDDPFAGACRVVWLVCVCCYALQKESPGQRCRASTGGKLHARPPPHPCQPHASNPRLGVCTVHAIDASCVQDAPCTASFVHVVHLRQHAATCVLYGHCHLASSSTYSASHVHAEPAVIMQQLQDVVFNEAYAEDAVDTVRLYLEGIHHPA